ncbi:MAG: lipopolysaccharide heptosyltransferase II [Deltaproteobacteria bacterium]|nr:lipopolysaccharide heptosyltransferase II [Deltaproteobacteria bacterium]MCB9479532.1 lipopolysaccharide heptosyltransferase II [Deltaproteobacteria bacterium]MCB9488438.1 lipopolysaccharide heptosyltransferase II [Deltaproteobacteria bacterium]
MSENPERVLIFQTAYLGDVVLTTPLIQAVHDRFPDAAIDIVVQPQWAPIVQHHRHIRQVIAYDKRGADEGLGNTIRFARELAKEKYDIVFCPHPSFRSGLILFLAGIKKRIGFDDSSGRYFYNTKVHRDTRRHEVLRILSLMSAVDGKTEPAPPLHIDSDPAFDRAALMRRCGIREGAKLAGIHPGSVWATKRWLPERFGEVAKHLADSYDQVVIFGGPGEEELATQVAIEAGVELVNLAGRLALDELIVAISAMNLFVTNDSGPMHIASAFGVPVVAVFGSTVPRLGYAPWGEKSSVVEIDLSCRPCGPHGHQVCPLDHFKCMREITAAMVLEACAAFAVE